MNSEINNYQINTTRNYYLYFLTITIITVIVIALIEISKPSLILGIGFFFIIEAYFFFRKHTVSLRIVEDDISVVYFQFLKKHIVSSNLNMVQITKDYNISFRSSIKKFTLTIIVNGKKFVINLHEGYNEQDLISFYEYYLNRKEKKDNF
jgi:hypothetical protein